MERAPLLALHEHVQVVHPRVVGTEVAPPDEQVVSVAAATDRRPQPLTVGNELGRRELDASGRGAQDLGDPRLERAEVDAVGVRLEQGERDGRLLDTLRIGERLACAEPVAVGP